MQTIKQLTKLRKKPNVTRWDLTALKIQENIRKHNNPENVPKAVHGLQIGFNDGNTVSSDNPCLNTKRQSTSHSKGPFKNS